MKLILKGCLALIIFAVFILSFFHNQLISMEMPKIFSAFAAMFNKPDDLYEDLVNEELNFTKTELSFEFVFTHKYPGKHNAGIYLKRFTNDLYFDRYKPKFKLALEFYYKNELIVSEIIEDNFDPFIIKDGGGYFFFIYSVPDDLPNKKPIVCKLKFIEMDKKILYSFGPLNFFIRKRSDL